jgi:hypothetical protein
VGEVPVLHPLVETGVLDVPSAPDRLERGSAAYLAGALAYDGERPGVARAVPVGNDGTDHTDLALEGAERLDVVGIVLAPRGAPRVTHTAYVG